LPIRLAAKDLTLRFGRVRAKLKRLPELGSPAPARQRRGARIPSGFGRVGSSAKDHGSITVNVYRFNPLHRPAVDGVSPAASKAPYFTPRLAGCLLWRTYGYERYFTTSAPNAQLRTCAVLVTSTVAGPGPAISVTGRFPIIANLAGRRRDFRRSSST